ncbi:MAG: glutamine synthetase family protein [Actinomycetota bacterium]|nr:glutamine synthetase family protein [Actinomycetota bacterium]
MTPGGPPGLDLDSLRIEVDAGRVDTVLLVVTDMQGRLQGKRMSARYFLDDALAGVEACNYLLAVDVDMNTVDGYAMSSWSSGYGDFVLRPDLASLRRIPWQEGTVLITCDLERPDGAAVVASPRQILKAQLDRLADRGWAAYVGTELEFLLFDESYESAWHKGYQQLLPANLYNVDYSMLGTARVEPLLRRIRLEMAGAGMVVESAKGECNLGQHEIAFKYSTALSTCDDHVVYKNGAKEIAAQEGKAITFMAKFNEREGNSCHIHFSLRGADDGAAVFSDGGHGHSPLFEQFLAGQLAGLRELTLWLAPNINSYKRFAKGSFAPTAVAWGLDNRTCALRVVGHDGPSLRFENRVPGGDVNPYLAVAALIAAGLHGVDAGLDLEEAYPGNAYDSDKPRVPSTLQEAADLWSQSRLARSAFGSEVVEHYANMARVELDAFGAAVTDWERYRGFERL